MSSMIYIPVSENSHINVPFIVSDELYSLFVNQSSGTSFEIIDRSYGPFDSQSTMLTYLSNIKNELSSNQYFPIIKAMPAVFYNDGAEFSNELLLDVLDFISPNRKLSTASGQDIYLENYLWANNLSNIDNIYYNKGSSYSYLTSQPFPVQRTEKGGAGGAFVSFSVIKSSSLIDGKFNFSLDDYSDTGGKLISIRTGISISNSSGSWRVGSQMVLEKNSQAPLPLSLNGIKSNPIEFESLSVEPISHIAKPGETIQYKAILNGEETNDGIVWSLYKSGDSENDSNQLEGVSISETGLVTVGDMTINKLNVKALSTVYERSKSVILINVNSPYDEGGNSGPGGGGGSGSPGGGPSGPGTDTLVPNGSNNPNVASGGTFTMYAANMGTLQGLGAWLYSSNFFDAVGRDIMSSLWNSPIDGIISVTAFPFGVPASSNVPEQIKFGCLEVPISLPVLQNSSMQINWGSVTIEPTWNNFLDYAPHTKIELYLPFSTGFVNIDPADVINGTISIVTNVDLIKGTCVHIVSGKYGVIGTYGGICGVQIPVSAIDTSGKALNLLVSSVTTAVTAGAGAVGHDMQALGAISKTPGAGPSLPPMPGAPQLALPGSAPNTTVFANKVINVGKQFSAIASRTAHVAGKTAVAAFRTPASVQRSGSFATNAGGLGPTTPFIIYSCPDLNIPRDYGHFYGYPLNATMRVGDLKGYSEITGVHLNNIPALLPELDEISSLLEGGVIL